MASVGTSKQVHDSAPQTPLSLSGDDTEAMLLEVNPPEIDALPWLPSSEALGNLSLKGDEIPEAPPSETLTV